MAVERQYVIPTLLPATGSRMKPAVRKSVFSGFRFALPEVATFRSKPQFGLFRM